MACRKGFAHSQLGTGDTPISLRCYGFARYVVVTLPGTGRQIALREIDVFVIEKFDGTACPNEFKAPPEPPPFPPATPPPPAAGSCDRKTCRGAVLVGSKGWKGGSKTVNCGFDCKNCRLMSQPPASGPSHPFWDIRVSCRTNQCIDRMRITTGGGRTTMFRPCEGTSSRDGGSSGHQCDGQNSWGQNMCVYCDGDEDNIHGRVCQDEYAVTDSGYSE